MTPFLAAGRQDLRCEPSPKELIAANPTPCSIHVSQCCWTDASTSAVMHSSRTAVARQLFLRLAMPHQVRLDFSHAGSDAFYLSVLKNIERQLK